MKKTSKREIPIRPPAKPAAPARRKILVVDDHPMTRSGVVHLLSKQEDLTVSGEAGSPSEAFAQMDKLCPDLVLTDMTMPGRSGFEFVKDLLALRPELSILILSMHDEAIYAERALRAGARGYIMKEAGGEKLLAAVRRVLGGQVYVSDAMSAKILDTLSGGKPRGSSSPIEKLSDREFEVFQLIGRGKSTRNIAEQLHLSPKTVDAHRGSIKEKLDLRDATSLVRHAVRWMETQDASKD